MRLKWKWIISVLYIIVILVSLYMRDLGYLIITIFLFNLLAFVIFGYDKRSAKLGRWRVPESLFFLWSFLGAAFGVLVGMKLFRHKTKHRNFQILIPLLFLWNIAWFYLLFMEINK